MFSREFWEIFEKIYFEEHLRTAASGNLQNFLSQIVYQTSLAQWLASQGVLFMKLDIVRTKCSYFHYISQEAATGGDLKRYS